MAFHPLRYFRNNTLRVLCPEQPGAVNCKGNAQEADEGGFVGSLAHEFKTYLQWNVEMVSSTSRSFGECYENGTCTEASALFSENKVDVGPIPTPLVHLKNKPFIEGPAVGSFSHHIFSEYQLRPKEMPFLSTLDVFPLEIWALVVFFVLLVSLIFYFTNVNHTLSRYLNILWQIMRFIPGQGDYAPVSFQEKILFLTYSFGCFVLVNYFGNLMSTEKISVDYSVLDMTLEDVYRHGKYPVFWNIDSGARFVYQEATNPKTIQYKLWQKAKDVGLQKSVLILDPEDPIKTVHKSIGKEASGILYKELILNIAGLRCQANIKEKQLLSTRETGSFTFFFIKHKNLSQAANAALDDLSYRVMESGALGSVRRVRNRISTYFEIPDKNLCLRHTVAEVAADVNNELSPISCSIISPLFLCLFVALSFCVIPLFLEIMIRRMNACTPNGLTVRHSESHEMQGVGQLSDGQVRVQRETTMFGSSVQIQQKRVLFEDNPEKIESLFIRRSVPPNVVTNEKRGVSRIPEKDLVVEDFPAKGLVPSATAALEQQPVANASNSRRANTMVRSNHINGSEQVEPLFTRMPAKGNVVAKERKTRVSPHPRPSC